jgi:GMP synthase (glutamine-hydrolysing)
MEKNFEVKKFIIKAAKGIKNQVGRKKAIVAVSGGVDSTTCAVLAYKAICKQLKAVFIDDGLMRENEGKIVKKALVKAGINLRIVNAQKEFFSSLKGIEDPEEKRKIFRETFYRVLGEIVKEYRAKFLIQGTIKADILETKGGIKTQHNVLEQIGINPKKYGFKVIEPLKELFKPQVREVAKALGLPKEIFLRMPFPGPGLATRIVGEVTPERVEIVRKATKIVEEEIKQKDFPNLFQAFAVLLADKGTGIKNDQRLFGNIIVIRSVDSKDALTATPSKIPWEILQKISKRITKEVPSVIRVSYELTPKPPATIEYI